jgi:urease accessory protein
VVPALAAHEPRSRIGRDGFLRLAFDHRRGATVLAERRFRTPLQVLEALSFAPDPAVGILLLNPTGGVLGGDHLRTELALADGAHVVVSTPSATRIYGTRGAAAILATVASVGPGATLEYVPDHVIPHPHARLEQSLDVALAPGARLLLWDAWALGRPTRGELWKFDRLASTIRVCRAGVPLFVDRMMLDRTSTAHGNVTGAGSYSYFASWLVCDDGRADVTALANDLGDAASSIAGIRAAGTRLAAGGVLVRMLASTAYALVDAQRRLWALTRDRVLGLPALDLRKA